MQSVHWQFGEDVFTASSPFAFRLPIGSDASPKRRDLRTRFGGQARGSQHRLLLCGLGSGYEHIGGVERGLDALAGYVEILGFNFDADPSMVLALLGDCSITIQCLPGFPGFSPFSK